MNAVMENIVGVILRLGKQPPAVQEEVKKWGGSKVSENSKVSQLLEKILEKDKKVWTGSEVAAEFDVTYADARNALVTGATRGLLKKRKDSLGRLQWEKVK